MQATIYRYQLNLFRKKDNAPLGSVPVEVDWEPAHQWTILQGQRRNLLPALLNGAVTTIEPVWNAQLAEPYVDAVRVSVAANGSAAFSAEIPIAYFKDAAQEAALALVNQGLLATGDAFLYVVAAYPGETEPEEAGGRDFAFEDVATPLPLKPARLARFLNGAVALGPANDNVLPVFIPRTILNEGGELTRLAGACETAGLLIGHLYQDTTVPEICAVVTAQIPAQFGQADAMKFTFTKETWAAAKAAIELRGREECYLGWWHSHPTRFWADMCKKDCPPERRKNCALKSAGDFFSETDASLHRICFSAAHSIALVITHAEEGLTNTMYGWQNGLIAQRGFYIAPPDAIQDEPLPTQQKRKEKNKHACTPPAQ